MAVYDNNLQALVPNDMNIADKKTKEKVGELIRELYSGDNLMQDVPSAGIKVRKFRIYL